jgi:hypothetical protein
MCDEQTAELVVLGVELSSRAVARQLATWSIVERRLVQVRRPKRPVAGINLSDPAISLW